MANDTIDSGLYEEAIAQIVAQLNAESPSSETTKRLMAGETRANAEQMFSHAWHTARQMQITQAQDVAGRSKFEPAPLDEAQLARLRPEDVARMRKRREERIALLTKSLEGTQKMFDDYHRRTLTKLFTNNGISKPTAEKLAELVVEMSQVAA